MTVTQQAINQAIDSTVDVLVCRGVLATPQAIYNEIDSAWRSWAGKKDMYANSRAAVYLAAAEDILQHSYDVLV